MAVTKKRTAFHFVGDCSEPNSEFNLCNKITSFLQFITCHETLGYNVTAGSVYSSMKHWATMSLHDHV